VDKVLCMSTYVCNNKLNKTITIDCIIIIMQSKCYYCIDFNIVFRLVAVLI